MSPRLVHYSDLENVYDAPERVGRLASLLRSLDGDDAVLAGTGDNTAPGVLPLVADGAQALDLFDAIQPDVETFGNHEFDHGPDALRDIVTTSPQTWVSANVWDGEQRFGDDHGVRPWTTLQADGATVGVVGVTTPRTDSLNPLAADLEFVDPVDAAQDALADLREHAGADLDYSVVLSHLGRGDEDLARAVDADVILGGHVPTERNEVVDGTLLTRPGDGGSVVLEVDLEPDGTDRSEVTRHEITDAPVHDGVATAMDDRLASAGLDEVVSTLADPIDRSETTLFGGESRLGNVVADAYRWATGADVGLQNSGGVRTGEPLTGEVTAADVVSVTPFEDDIVVAEVSGTALREAFEWAAGPDLGFAEPDWWHAQISGATVVWDPDACTVESVEIGGDPLDPDADYTVAMSDYVLHTDDEFPSIAEADAVRRGDVQYEVLVEYARETGVDPAIEGRVRETC